MYVHPHACVLAAFISAHTRRAFSPPPHTSYPTTTTPPPPPTTPHTKADELSADLSSRRKSTVAAMLGRVQLDNLTEQQQAALMGPSPAARILDLLLSMQDSSDRLALLPDCFTPPPPPPPAAPQDAPDAAAAAAGEGDDGSETDELWCTPMQLMNEILSRLNTLARAATAAAAETTADEQAALPPGGSTSSSRQPPALPPSDGGVCGAELVDALQELQQHIQEQWLESLPQPQQEQQEGLAS